MIRYLDQFAQKVDLSDVDIPKSVKSIDGAVLQNILQIVFLVAGGISLIFIVIGGLKYVLSTGDPQETKKAKDTILYAIIGLILSLLAFVIVAVVIRTIQG